MATIIVTMIATYRSPCFGVEADSGHEAETVAHLAVEQITVNPWPRGVCVTSLCSGASQSRRRSEADSLRDEVCQQVEGDYARFLFTEQSPICAGDAQRGLQSRWRKVKVVKETSTAVYVLRRDANAGWVENKEQLRVQMLRMNRRVSQSRDRYCPSSVTPPVSR